MSVYMRGLERETCAGPNANLSLMRWAGRLGILHIHTQVPEVEDYRIIYTHRCQRCQSVHFDSTRAAKQTGPTEPTPAWHHEVPDRAGMSFFFVFAFYRAIEL